MRVRKTEMKMQEVVVEQHDLCDKCGEKIPFANYDAFRCELEYREGFNYPEGGCWDEWRLDLCKECAPMLIKLLRSNGYEIQHSAFEGY